MLYLALLLDRFTLYDPSKRGNPQQNTLENTLARLMCTLASGGRIERAWTHTCRSLRALY